MKVFVKLKESTIERNLQTIQTMLLYGKIKLSCISYSQRIRNRSLYIMALRHCISAYNCSEFIMCLKILSVDILLCKDMNERKTLLNVFNSYVNFNPFIGDKRFENNKEIILRQIQIRK